MSQAASARHACPDCGAEIAAGQTRCWLCERRLSGEELTNPYASPAPIYGNSGSQFSLASLLLVMTLVAVCVGVFKLVPGLGILLGIFALPALVRTSIDVTKHKQRGSPLGMLGKVGSFVVSLVIAVTVTIAAFAAAFAVCAVGFSTGGIAPELALIIANGGLLVGLAVMVGLFWLTRPRV